MLKQFGVMVVVALATAACGGAGAQPASPAASDTALPKLSVPLPDKYKTAGKLNVGVKCDYPPFGYTDEQGKIVGYELDLTRRLAAFAFGSTDAVNLQCVTSANRISFLTTNRIDLIVATITYTPERAKTITFSDPYFSAAGRLLVPKDSTVKEATDLAGKTAITAKGSVYVTYFQKCVPNATLLQFEATSDSLAALTQSRGQAFMQDDTLLVGLAKQNPNLKVVGSGVASAPWGIGIRQEDKDLANWINAALAQNQKDDWNWKAFQKWITDKDTQNRFSASVPRPGKSLKYGEGPTVTC